LESKWKIKYDLLRLNYVARYTGSLLFLFERTNNYFVYNQGLVPVAGQPPPQP
jgi:hypothetical protein